MRVIAAPRGRQLAALTLAASQELETHATRVAFVSTPSVYFSLAKGSALARSSMVFDVRGPQSPRVGML